jgi:hypothetical protein|tara:strand:- start:365 stop:646 length:282 start_codon:yes stop_codon:yes gene_type:complete
MQPTTSSTPPTTLIFIIIVLLLWVGHAAVAKDYTALQNGYLESIGRSDLIERTEVDKAKQEESLAEEVLYLRKDVNKLLKKMDLSTSAPSASI